MKAEQIDQSLESQLKMARPRKAEVKRVPLTPEEKEFLGEIIDKAVAAEKAGELKEALDLYTDYKDELLKIKKEKEQPAYEIWRDVINEYLESQKRVFIRRYMVGALAEMRSKAPAMTKSTYSDKIKNIRKEIDDIIKACKIHAVGVGVFLWEKYNAADYLKSLNIFNIKDEDKQYGESIFPILRTIDEDIKYMEENYEIKPELKEDIEKILRQDEKIQAHVEKLYQEELEAQKKLSE